MTKLNLDFLKKRRTPVRRRGQSGDGHPAPWSFTVAEVALFVVSAAAIAVIPLAATATPVALHAFRAERAVGEAERLAGEGDFTLASVRAETASAEFAAARVASRRLRPLAFLPVIGEYVTAAGSLFSAGESGAAAAASFLTVAADLSGALGEGERLAVSAEGFDLGALVRDLTPESRRRLLAAAIADLPKLRDAQERASLAVEAFDGLSETGVAGRLRSRLAPVRDRLATARDALAAVLPVAESLPAALGYPEPRRYLIFFENNTELRPTGGFLGVYSLATVKDAELESLTTNDVYFLDAPSESRPRPAPPEPLKRYLGVSKWFLRDANWSPDFPTSAALMDRFFKEESAVIFGADKVPPVDGIVAITPEIVKDVLLVVGPVTVEGKTFTADNVVDELEYEVEKGYVRQGISQDDRKDIVGRLADEVMGRVQSASLDQLLALSGVLDTNLREKHLLVWFRDPALQAMAKGRGWTGELVPPAVDGVAVVDANLAALKTDQAMTRQVRYSVRPEGDGYVGSVAVEYENRGSFTWKTTRYRTYTRVYVPAGSELIEVRGAMYDDKIKDPSRRPGTADSGDELGRRWFGAFISVEPGEKRTLEFRFRLAPSVARAVAVGDYRLEFTKQAGTVGHALTLDLDFGKKLADAEPAEGREEWGDTRYRLVTDLREDRVFRINF